MPSFSAVSLWREQLLNAAFEEAVPRLSHLSPLCTASISGTWHCFQEQGIVCCRPWWPQVLVWLGGSQRSGRNTNETGCKERSPRGWCSVCGAVASSQSTELSNWDGSRGCQQRAAGWAMCGNCPVLQMRTNDKEQAGVSYIQHVSSQCWPRFTERQTEGYRCISQPPGLSPLYSGQHSFAKLGLFVSLTLPQLLPNRDGNKIQ